MRFLFFFLSTWMFLSFQTTTITAERSSNALTRKMNALCSPFRSSGFITFKHGDLSMERRTEFPIFVDLKEGRWYQFCIVGDPKATRLEFKLASDMDGNMVTDKFNVDKTGEYWTGFSFICPRSGRYLLTFYQRSDVKHLQGQITILQKPVTTENGVLTYSH